MHAHFLPNQPCVIFVLPSILFALVSSAGFSSALAADNAHKADAAPKAAARAERPIAIAEVKLAEPVNFARDVLPIFRSNCVACHNAKESKAGLVLETPKSIRTGGESGPAAIPGKARIA